MVSHNTFQCVRHWFCGVLGPWTMECMSSLGAGGEETPFLVNAANALVFGLSKSYRLVRNSE
jgi:hypothetical protein